MGGLAGTNVGDGSPDDADLEEAARSGNFGVELAADDEAAHAGHSGGAVGQQAVPWNIATEGRR